jgi:hypothetical protein
VRFFLLLWLFAATPAWAGEIEGHWQYYLKIFKGNEMPEPPEATLRLHFEFYPDGTNRLYWWHEGEDDLCSRTGRYRLEKGILIDEVIAVDPKNHGNCSRDPDMQLGKISRTPYELKKNQLILHLPFGDDTLLYVWKRIPPRYNP